MVKAKNDKFRVRIKLDCNGGVVGPGKAEWMKKIELLGSISAAAKDMGINYRRAWFLLETLHEPLGQPVVHTSKGGPTGGGANLSESGRAILDAYEQCVLVAEKSTMGVLEKLRATLNKQEASL